ncbi:MAG TPA: hypothetical protein VLC93_17250, partial [Myxococcota bacterium]|nr:hypothetical protein [Myxococcota bacterium]
SPALAVRDGRLVVATAWDTFTTIRERSADGSSWVPIGAGIGGPESLLVDGFRPWDIDIAVLGSSVIVAMRELVTPGDRRIHLRSFSDGGWRNLGGSPEPGGLPAGDYQRVRIATGPKGEVILAYTARTLEGGVALFVMMWRDQEWLPLRYEEVATDSLTPSTWQVRDFDVRVGGERVCIGWTARPDAVTEPSAALLCGWL